MELQIIGVC